MRKILVPTILALLMIVLALPVAPAHAQSEETALSGVVLAIGAENGVFLLQTEAGQNVVVYAPQGFDLTTITVGVAVTVSGTWNADGSFAASAIQIAAPTEEPPATPTPEPGETPTEEPVATPVGQGFYCQEDAPPHPFGARLAERYGVDYQQVKQYFCEGFGWGEIVLAMHTARVMEGVDPNAMLEARRNGQGWGEIWHGMGLLGRPKDANSAGDQDGDGLPDRLRKRDRDQDRDQDRERDRDRDRDRDRLCTPPCTPQAPGQGQGRPDVTRTPKPNQGHGRGPKR